MLIRNGGNKYINTIFFQPPQFTTASRIQNRISRKTIMNRNPQSQFTDSAIRWTSIDFKTVSSGSWKPLQVVWTPLHFCQGNLISHTYIRTNLNWFRVEKLCEYSWWECFICICMKINQCTCLAFPYEMCEGQSFPRTKWYEAGDKTSGVATWKGLLEGYPNLISWTQIVL